MYLWVLSEVSDEGGGDCVNEGSSQHLWLKQIFKVRFIIFTILGEPAMEDSVQ